MPDYLCGSCKDTGKWSNGIICPVCVDVGGKSAVMVKAREQYRGLMVGKLDA